MARALGTRFGWRGALVLPGEYFDAAPTGEIVGTTSLSLSPTATLADLPPTEVNFGNETLGTTTFPCSGDRAFGTLFTLSDDGELVSGEVGFTATSGGGGNAKLLVYTDAGSNTPGTLIAVSSSVALTAGGGFFPVTFANEAVTAGDYFLIAVCDGGAFANYHACTTPSTPDSVMANGTLSYASPPGTWPGTSASYDQALSAFVTVATDSAPPSGEIVGSTSIALAISGTLINLTPLPTNNFGDENLYTDVLAASDGRALVDRFTLPEDGTITSITVGFHTTTTAGANMKGLIFADNGSDLPGVLVAVGASTPVPSGGGWVKSLVADVPLTAGLYWIGAVCDSFEPYHAHDTIPSGTAPDAQMANGTMNFASPVNWPGSDASYDYNISAYATYSTAAPAGEIEGSTSITLAPAGVLAGVGALVGATSLSLSPAATLRGAGRLIGSSSVTFAPSATGSATALIVGTTSITLAPSATLAAAGRLIATTSITLAPSATLAASAALTGSSSLTFAPSATLRGAAALTGSTSLAITTTATISSTSALVGASSLTFAPAGTLAASGRLVGSSSVTFAPSATLAASGRLIGSSSLTFASTATLRGAVAATGSTSLTFAPAGVLAAGAALVGTTSVTFAPSGTIVALAEGLVGPTSIAFATSATLRGTGAMAATTTVTLAPAATGQLLVPISGITSLTFATSATLRATGRLVGSSSVVFAPSATLRAAGRLVGATSVAFATTASGTATASATGTTSLTLAPSATLRASASAIGATTLTFAATGAVTATGRLVGSTSVTFSTFAVPGGGWSLISGESSVSLTPSASLGATVRITGSSSVSLTPAATLRGTARLIGSTATTLTTTGTGILIGKLDGAAFIAVALVGELLGRAALQGGTSFTFGTEASFEGGSPPPDAGEVIVQGYDSQIVVARRDDIETVTRMDSVQVVASYDNVEVIAQSPDVTETDSPDVVVTS